MEEDTKLFGKLFNTIPLTSEEHLDVIIQTMTKESALYILGGRIRFLLKSNTSTK